MTAVIALRGLPRGQVVAAKANDESDYAFRRRDGDRVRAHVNAAGRVAVDRPK
jgi:hypothetical protein